MLGVIGRNGAGKSTLLRILTRITTPTSGRAEIRGRVGSLLEVGTGFHPELTGRENVFLNGSVLGMKQREIQGKFDEIVEFAGVEQFVDTPVKRYSSGMSVRLAFAVAAHLEPEILLVDEVLAVGDAEFQRRCLGRMEDLSESGRTVVFVSHQMQAVSQLCDRAILLEKGSVTLDGPSGDVVAHYLQRVGGSGSTRSWPEVAKAPGDDLARLLSVRSSMMTETPQTPPTYGDQSGSRSASACFALTDLPSSRRSRSTTPGATSCSAHWTRARGGASLRRPVSTCRPPGFPATSSTKGSSRWTSDLFGRPAEAPSARGLRGRRLVPRPGRG